MSRLTRDGTAEPVSRDQILRHARGQGNVHFPCSADHEQDWQPYPVDPYPAICDDHTYIHTYTIYWSLPVLNSRYSMRDTDYIGYELADVRRDSGIAEKRDGGTLVFSALATTSSAGTFFS